MIIGGAPGSTAGGIKVVVFAVLEAVIVTTLLGKKEVVLFWRKIETGFYAKKRNRKQLRNL